MKKITVVLMAGLICLAGQAQDLQALLRGKEYKAAIAEIDLRLETAGGEDRKELVLQKARCLRNLRDLEGAIAVLEKEAGDDTGLMSELAEYISAAGDQERALAIYETLAESNPDNTYFLIRRAMLENATEQYQKSLGSCIQICERDSLADILSLMGHNYIHRFHPDDMQMLADHDSAIVCYAQALKRKPLMKNAVLQTMWLYNARSEFGPGIEVAKKYLDRRPDDKDVNVGYARMLFKNRDFEQSLDAMTHQVADLKDSIPENLYLMGSCAYSLKRYPLAVKLFTECRDKSLSDSFEVLFSLGQSWARAFNPDSAVFYLNMAEQILQPDTTLLYRCESEMGQALFSRTGSVEESIRHYKKALEFNPEYRDAPYRIGYAYELMKNYDQAIKWYQRYLTYPDTPKNRREWVEQEIDFLKAEAFMEKKE